MESNNIAFSVMLHAMLQLEVLDNVNILSKIAKLLASPSWRHLIRRKDWNKLLFKIYPKLFNISLFNIHPKSFNISHKCLENF